MSAAFKSDFAILDVKVGRAQLARRIAAGAKICVRIEMLIDNQHGHDDGTSMEFSGQVLFVTELETAPVAGCGSAT